MAVGTKAAETTSVPAQPAQPRTLTCPRDGTATRLTCVECGTPICPSCLVRTPVGMMCPNHTVSARFATAGRRRSALVAVAVAVVVAGLAVLAGLQAVGRDPGPADDISAATGSGSAGPDGSWAPALGREVALAPFTVTVTGFECVGKVVGMGAAARTANGRYCLATLRVRNDGVEPRAFQTPFQRVTDGVRRFGPDPLPTGPRPSLVLASGTRELLPFNINPGAVLEGVMVFDVPETVTPTAIELHMSPRDAAVRIPVTA